MQRNGRVFEHSQSQSYRNIYTHIPSTTGNGKQWRHNGFAMWHVAAHTLYMYMTTGMCHIYDACLCMCNYSVVE